MFPWSKEGDRSDVGWRSLGPPAAILLLIGLFLALDLATDQEICPDEIRHLYVEGVAALIAFGGALWVFLFLRMHTKEIERLSGDLVSAREEAQRWRRETSELLQGLSNAIDEQLSRWELTPAEKEVALLLLKGLSTREIAHLRDTREPTVRQQAQVVYRKANLEGRAELAAFFLEDLLAPHSELHAIEE